LSPLAFLGVPLFSSKIFFEPIDVFRGASFFIECIFKPMREGSDSTPSLMASLSSAWALVEYGAKLVSDFDRVRCFGETNLLLLLWGTCDLPC
jgi:hypothetical protein